MCLAVAGAAALGPAEADGSSAGMDRSTLAVRAAAGEANAITLRIEQDGAIVEDASAPLSAGTGCRAESERRVRCPRPGSLVVSLLDGHDSLVGQDAAAEFGLGSQLSGGAGDDRIDWTGNSASTIEGGDGDDAITAAGANAFADGGLGDDVVTGSKRRDVLRGGGGHDRLFGRGGHDTLTDSDGTELGDGTTAAVDADLYDGGTGRDGVSYASRDNPVALDLSSSASAGEAGEGDTLTDIEGGSGGHAADTLTGGARYGRFHGHAGDDVLTAGRGGARLTGGADADRLRGSARADWLSGGSGDDALVGGAGADDLDGERGRDRVDAGGGNDSINSADHRDAPNEVVRCGGGRDEVTPDAHDDLVSTCERVRALGPATYTPTFPVQPRLVRGGVARLPFRCAAPRSCRVAVELRHRGRVVGSGVEVVPAHRRGAVRVRLMRRAGRRAIRLAITVRYRLLSLHGNTLESDRLAWRTTVRPRRGG